MTKNCAQKEFQQMPTTGQLQKNMNLSLQQLKEKIKQTPTDQNQIFTYKLSTISIENNALRQTGSAPNIEGGIITLCTCKHYHRSRNSQQQWENRWIAGFTTIGITPKRVPHLFYLMKVQKTYTSQKEIYNNLPKHIINKKNTKNNTFGDIYQPKPTIEDPYDPTHYCEPTKTHSHYRKCEWHKDISYKGKRHLMIVGDPKQSYLWSKPLIYRDMPTDPRTKITGTMDEFLSYLKE